jgi:hypothetical protein
MITLITLIVNSKNIVLDKKRIRLQMCELLEEI